MPTDATRRQREPRITLVGLDAGAPSLRLRLRALVPFLAAAGFDPRVEILPRRPTLLRVLARWRLFAGSDVVVFSKIRLLAGERALARRACPNLVLDLDDPIMIGRPRRHGDPPDRAGWRRRRFARMVRACRLVVAGSHHLAATIDGARRVAVWPTPVDLGRYPTAPFAPGRPARLAWIGLPSNLRYLGDLVPVLRELHASGVEFEVHVISGRAADLPGIPARFVAWSEASEAGALAACDVALAPLPDDEWTRGKGGYRCIQYAAAGLPTVCSPVGAQREIVVDGRTGIWASTPEEWKSALARLIADDGERRSLGAAARRGAAAYDLATAAPRYVRLLAEIASVNDGEW